MGLGGGRPGQSGGFQYSQLKAYTATMTAMRTVIPIIKDNTQQPWLEHVTFAVSTYFTVSRVALRSSHYVMTRETVSTVNGKMATSRWEERTVSLVPRSEICTQHYYLSED